MPDSEICSDCELPLDDHCTECGECYCENEECQECPGHESVGGAHMGETVYCDVPCGN